MPNLTGKEYVNNGDIPKEIQRMHQENLTNSHPKVIILSEDENYTDKDAPLHYQRMEFNSMRASWSLSTIFIKKYEWEKTAEMLKNHEIKLIILAAHNAEMINELEQIAPTMIHSENGFPQATKLMEIWKWLKENK